MGDNNDTSITSATSQLESSNNNNNESTNFKKWHSESQKSSGTISKPPRPSKTSLRSHRSKPKEQVIIYD